MPTMKRSWNEKLNESTGLPRVEKITDKMSKKWGEGTVVIPSPIEVDELMRGIPSGKLTTINDIRFALAKKTQSNHRLPYDYRYIHMDCRPCGRREKTTR